MLIHYVWTDFKNEMNANPRIPDLLLERIEMCGKVNPDDQITIWTGPMCRQLLIDHYPSYLPTYDSLQEPIMRCDMIRYFILYHYGGVYVDCDRIMVKPFSKLIEKYKDYDVLLGGIPFFLFKVIINNDFMYSRPGSDFMKYCMDRVEPLNIPIRELAVHRTAGPLFLQNCYDNYGGSSNIKVLKEEVNNCDGCKCNASFEKCYTIADISNSSWHVGPEAITKFIYCNLYTIFWILVLVLVIYYLTRRRR